MRIQFSKITLFDLPADGFGQASIVSFYEIVQPPHYSFFEGLQRPIAYMGRNKTVRCESLRTRNLIGYSIRSGRQ